MVGDIFEVVIPAGSSLINAPVQELEMGLNYQVSVIATRDGDEIRIRPPRDQTLRANTALALIGTDAVVQKLCDTYKLERTGRLINFAEVLTPSRAGISEIVIPPYSSLVGKSLQQ